MKNHVVMDASYFINFLEDASNVRYEWMKSSQLVSSELFKFEIINWLSRNADFEERTTAALDAADIKIFSLQLSEVEAVSRLACKSGLTGYDASYLHLAKKYKYMLATNDEKLKRAAVDEGLKVFFL
jgi:predicted nucleic acid-binding protein